MTEFSGQRMHSDLSFDMVLVGNYTKDTITSRSGTRVVDGGGFNYGAHVGAMMGLRTAAVTRLAKKDTRVIDALGRLGVAVFPAYTPKSTTLRLYYPTANLDERVVSVTHIAGSFAPEQVKNLRAKVFLVSASLRGEVGLKVIQELRRKDTLLAVDVQGFVRIAASDGTLIYDAWPERDQVLSQIDVLKADAVEAEMLTGSSDLRAAARIIAGWGPKEVVLSHSNGVLVLAEDDFFEAPFSPRQMVGRSGRGDTCIASYVARRLSAPPKEATIWAAALTSLKLEAEGPIKKKMAEVEELFEHMYSQEFLPPLV